jgi:hypothetical protein
VVTWLGALWRVLWMLSEAGPYGLLVGTAVAAGLVMAAFLAARAPRQAVDGRAVLVTRRGLRQRAERVGVPRHRDPDAAGHARPRAPAAVLAAA